MDNEIRGLVSDICKEVVPRNIIARPVGGEDKTDTDYYMDQAMASQAFGAHLSLTEADLFLVAKSAILQTLTEADRKNIQIIKQNLLLGRASPSYSMRLSHYYQEITKFLRTNRIETGIIDMIFASKYIYFQNPVGEIAGPSLALGVADAFMTLREAGKLTLEILGILPPRMRKLLPQQNAASLRTIELLLRDSCYNEYQKALDSRLAGGDYCEFFPVSADRYGIAIFDVSGHEERASRYRDILVKVISKFPDRTNPAGVLNALNRFVLQYPFPEDMFVSMVIGIVDLAESKFIFANAGHHPPYLVRGNKLNRLEDAGGVALNMDTMDYQNGSAQLQPMDCLVLYTDGLTEAVNQKVGARQKELFGHNRLEEAITEKKIGSLKAKGAVASILAAVRDQGFQIEDDITIQVYRHV